MQKKFIYTLFFLITGIILYFTLKQFPNTLFSIGTDRVWNTIRWIIVSAAGAFIFCTILILFLERRMVIPYFAKLHKFLPLLYQLVKRDFKAKYKRSILGILWTILNPLLTMLVLTIVFSTLFRFDIKNFPVYLLSGQVIFSFFSEATSLSMTSILGAGAMIKKVNMPKYIFPVSRVLSSLVNLMLSLLALLLVMAFTHSPFYWTILLSIIPIFYVFLFSLGIGLIMSAAIVFFRDMMYLYSIFLTALTYLTPLFYPISIIPSKFKLFFSLNPMYHYVEYFRTVSIYGGTPTFWQNTICLLMSIVSLTIGLYVFYKKQDRFILYI